MRTLDLAGRGGAAGLGENVFDPILATDLVEEDFRVVATKTASQYLAVFGQYLFRHAPSGQCRNEVLTDQSGGGFRHHAATDEKTTVIVDARKDLRFGAVGREDRSHDVHLPELHRSSALPALIGLEHLLPFALHDETASKQRTVDRHMARRIEGRLLQLELNALGSPEVMTLSHVEDPHFDLTVDLVRHGVRSMGLVGERL